MKIKKIFLSSIALLPLVFSGCSLSDVANIINKKDTTDKYEYTVMIYMCGSTLESEKYDNEYLACASSDIKEILGVTLNDNVKIIIETGGCSHWTLEKNYTYNQTSISNKKLQRWVVENKKLKLVESLNTNEMYKESSFESFLKWGLKDYSATKMGVILWNHGGGMGGVCYDEINGNYSLSAADIKTASKNALAYKYGSKSDRKFTWIGYDACLMSVADIASVNAPYYEYMIASQESEYADGWEYSSWVPLLNNSSKTTKDILEEISSTFVNQYHKYCGTSMLDEEDCYQTCSVLDLSKMDALTNAMNSYVNTMSGSKSQKFSTIKTAMKNSLNFGIAEIESEDSQQTSLAYTYGNVDLVDLFNHLQSSTGIGANNVISAVDDLVVVNNYCSRYTTSPCGVCAFVAAPYIVTNSYVYTSQYGNEMWVEKSQYSGDNSNIKSWQDVMLASSYFWTC